MILTYPASGLLPVGAHIQIERDDQGKDFATYRKFHTDGVIQAPGSGICIRIGSDRSFPKGFGPDYPYVRITTGPYAGPDGRGREWYIGHCHSRVKVGEKFGFGHVLADADEGIDFEGSKGGWCEFGEAFNAMPGPNLPSHWFDHLILSSLQVTIPDPNLHYGMSGPLIHELTSRLADCGYLPGWKLKFDRAVHGAVVAFKAHHHIPMPRPTSDRGIVDAHTSTALRFAAHWCRQHHRHEV